MLRPRDYQFLIERGIGHDQRITEMPAALLEGYARAGWAKDQQYLAADLGILDLIGEDVSRYMGDSDY